MTASQKLGEKIYADAQGAQAAQAAAAGAAGGEQPQAQQASAKPADDQCGRRRV